MAFLVKLNINWIKIRIFKKNVRLYSENGYVSHKEVDADEKKDNYYNWNYSNSSNNSIFNI